MKKKILAILIMSVLLATIPAFAKPYHQWVDSKVGAGHSRNDIVVADSAGNVWVSGMFNGKIILGGQEYQAKGELDAYIQKISPKGKILFTRVISGDSTDMITSMCCDAENIYVLGHCSEGVMFNGQTPIEMPQDVSNSGFVAKYSLKGELIWVKFTYSAAYIFNKIRINNNDLIVGMTFAKTLTYDNQQNKFESNKLYLFGVMMINPENGELRQMPKTTPEENIKEIYAYPALYQQTQLADFAIYNKNLYIVANEFPNPDSTDESQAFIFKAVLAVNSPNATEILFGDYTWNSNDSKDKALNIEINSLGEVIVSGYYYGDLVFFDDDDVETPIVIAKDANDYAGFVLGLTADLQKRWTHIIDHDFIDQIQGIHINKKNEIFLTGMISSDAAQGFKTNGPVDLFVEKLDYQGNREWLLTAGSKENNLFGDSDTGFGIVTVSNDYNESIYTVGAYDGTGIFGTDTLSKNDDYLHAATWKINNSQNYFVLKAGKISADYSDTCYLPISYTGNINLPQGKATTMQIELVFNSTLLYPLFDFDKQDITIDTIFIDKFKRRHVQYTITVNTYENNILAKLPFIVGWGNAVNTPIELQVLDWQSEVFIGFDGTEDGSFTLTGIEELDGEPILIEPGGTIVNMQIMPNLIADAGSIAVAVAENCQINLYVADMQGKRLLSIEDRYMAIGQYSYALDASQLTIGSYMLVAEVNGQILSTERFEIMR